MAVDTQSNPATLQAGLTIYGDEVIKALTAYALPLTGFARNFSKKISSQANGGIFVPFIEADTVADYVATTKNFGSGVAPAIKGANVTLGAHKLLQFAVTPEMVAEFDPLIWTERAKLNAKAIASAVFATIASVGASAKITNTHTLPKVLTLGDIIDVSYAAYGKDINVENATLYLAGKDYHDLIKALDYKTTGETIIINGNLGGVSVGFKAITCLPTNVTSGFVATPDFVCAAARPYVDGMGVGGNILEENIYDDETVGLPVVQTLVRDANTKKLVHNLDCWFGAELGNKAAGIKLVRAAE